MLLRIILNEDTRKVHRSLCEHPPEPGNQVPLGLFRDVHEALAAFAETFVGATCCFYCCDTCGLSQTRKPGAS
jgi:hypothetical protein